MPCGSQVGKPYAPAPTWGNFRSSLPSGASSAGDGARISPGANQGSRRIDCSSVPPMHLVQEIPEGNVLAFRRVRVEIDEAERQLLDQPRQRLEHLIEDGEDRGKEIGDQRGDLHHRADQDVPRVAENTNIGSIADFRPCKLSARNRADPAVWSPSRFVRCRSAKSDLINTPCIRAEASANCRLAPSVTSPSFLMPSKATGRIAPVSPSCR